MATKLISLIALGPIKHDGQRYEEGDALEGVKEANAAQLVASGAAATHDMQTARDAAERKADAALKAQEKADADAAAAAEAKAKADAKARATQDAAASIASGTAAAAGPKKSGGSK